MTGAHLPRKTIPLPQLVEYVGHMQRRSIQEALQAATAAYWHRRADTFLAARPRPGDFTGRANVDDLRDQWRRLTEIANACRARAQVALLEDLAPEVQAILREAA